MYVHVYTHTLTCTDPPTQGKVKEHSHCNGCHGKHTSASAHAQIWEDPNKRTRNANGEEKARRVGGKVLESMMYLQYCVHV